ncbi:hypothetical protein HK099_007816 [Clydaea vesicula]|uniref:Nitronate monooxygenase domain-containing protein n=1 Tax=Clydaea vesicula TaxID=447962 RepID=A0AAD5TY41_9FUNG|nr:hypothetical protein HK099_007816 [Clydaea vesicula]
MSETLVTPLSKSLKMKTPIFLAGMNVAAGPELCAAVSNAGGLGCIGGVGYTPDFLRKQIASIKKNLASPDLPFGIDLLLPQVGGSARKTNFDYTEGKLPELIDIVCKSGAKLFISAVGIPPVWAVDKLHAHKILVMNMIGAPKHAKKAIEAGCDIVCAQGGEGGGHTGDVPTSILIPAVVDACKGHFSKLTGEPIHVVAAGGIYDSRGLAMALSLGAQGVWVGTRFVCAKEAGAPPAHQAAVMRCGYDDTIRTIIFTGRPMRVIKNEYIMDWETNRRDEIQQLTQKGVIPYTVDQEKVTDPTPEDMKKLMNARPWLMGQVAGSIHDIKPAKEIMDEMTQGAIKILRENSLAIVPLAKL